MLQLCYYTKPQQCTQAKHMLGFLLKETTSLDDEEVSSSVVA